MRPKTGRLQRRVRRAAVTAHKPPLRLSPRESDVLQQLAEGLTYEAVGLVLGVSVNTVRAHVRALYEKLGVRNRLGALRAAESAGLLKRGS